MKTATLALLVRRNEVLLGKKRGGPEIGEGKLNGPGGKMEPPDKTLLDCLVRETMEEAGVDIDPSSAVKVAVITFFKFNDVADFKVHVYRVTKWTGEPRETKSMRDFAWYPLTKLPLERMHDGDRMWFARAVVGDKFRAQVYYRKRAEDFARIEFHPWSETH